MATFKIEKVVAALPSPLTPDTMYAVRSGVGFDLYVSDATGTAAHLVNSGPVRLTSAALALLVAGSQLREGQFYLTSDTHQLAAATSSTTYDLWMRAGEQGFVVSATAPAAPYVGQVWLQTP